MSANTVQNFEGTTVWKDAIELTVMVYEVTRKFPKDELFGMISQLRRASSSVSANLAEGYGRYGLKEKHQFYAIVCGSLLETKSFLLLAVRLKYIDDISMMVLLITLLQKQINSIKKSLR